MINNEFYKELGERWHTAEGDAVALLRLENKTKSPWVIKKILQFHGRGARVLDVGCGGGFLTLALADEGFSCTGMDVADDVLASGRARDPQGRVEWKTGQAESLPFADASFDVVCVMDVLEHVADPRTAVAEALRVLKPNGSFLFHTFNRTWLSWLFAAKGLEWFLPNSPGHIHDWKMFIKPKEFNDWLIESGYSVTEWTGIHPRFGSVVRLLLSGAVPSNFEFALGGGLSVGYLGCARRT